MVAADWAGFAQERRVAKDKILLADDVELFLELEKTFFRRENVEILVARTGVQAFEMQQPVFESLQAAAGSFCRSARTRAT